MLFRSAEIQGRGALSLIATGSTDMDRDKHNERNGGVHATAQPTDLPNALLILPPKGWRSGMVPVFFASAQSRGGKVMS